MGKFSISKKAMEDNRLSFAARGILAYLLAKPTEEPISVSDLRRAGRISRIQVLQSLMELANAGYLTDNGSTYQLNMGVGREVTDNE